MSSSTKIQWGFTCYLSLRKCLVYEGLSDKEDTLENMLHWGVYEIKCLHNSTKK